MGKVFKSVGKVLGFSAPKMPKMPTPIEPPAQQATKTADYETQRRRNEKTATRNATNLTGARGADTSVNALGRNVLLGQ